VREEVKAADFASLISDGSTDCSVLEQELVYVRTCKAGVVAVRFLGVISTPKADAIGITKSIGQAVQNALDVPLKEVFAQKLVALGADGAAVMMGGTRGVVTKLREMAPCLVGIHCYAHRLELAVKDVIKAHNMYGSLERLLLDLYLFYKGRLVNKNNNLISSDHSISSQ